jgi:hypothetical protein
LEIASKYKAKIFTRDFDSFTSQKAYALARARGEWVLNLDADEELSPSLREEIRNTLKDTGHDAFLLPISNFFWGREMKHGGLKKQLRLRLARRAKAKYLGGRIHETLAVDGRPAGRLNNIIKHYSYKTLTQYFDKFNRYSTLGAQAMHEQGKKFSAAQFARMPFEFIKVYFLRLGFLDGVQGFLWAAFFAFYPLVKYAKLWELERQK